MDYNYFVNMRIVTTDHEIDLNLNPSYTLFTPEQDAFYAEHPEASYWEIKNCRIIPEPIPPTLDDIKRDAINFLSEKSLSVLGKYVKEYQLANAQSSLYMLDKYPGHSTIYTEEKAMEIILTYDNVGLDLRTIFKEAETNINGCQDTESVENFKNYYTQQYENYVYNTDIEK